MTTVITVEGLMPPGWDRLTGFMRKVLRGYAVTDGRTQLRHKVGLSMSTKGMNDEAKSLNDTINSTSGTLVLLGHSRGAEIISTWLDLYGRNASPALVERISDIILIGNVSRKYGGKGGRRTEGTPIPTTPNDTAFEVTDFTRLLDSWSNADGWWGKPGVIGADRLKGSTAHNDYTKVRPDDPDVVQRAQVGRTTYLVTPR